VEKDRKSPQKKKQLEYTKDHFTFGWHSSRAFPKTWKRKKTFANREYRRKADQLVAQTKPGIQTEGTETITDSLTAARVRRKAVMHDVLHKTGTVTVGEKVKRKQEKREALAGRRVQRRKQSDEEAASAIVTLCSLNGNRLVEVVRRAGVLLCRPRNVGEWTRVVRSSDDIDRALNFLYQLTLGSSLARDAVCRNPELDKELTIWIEKANRILHRDRGAAEGKLGQMQATKKKLRATRNARLS
jgi:hypothetical protein